MIGKWLNWLDQRTEYRRLWLLPLRRRMLPDGPRWEYSTASCLLWLLVVEAVTGFLLMATYSPSTNSAWASVHYIEASASGSFIRGLHFFAAQALIVVFVAHTIRVLLRAAFRAPRELIWITGLLLAPLVVLWAITGNPLAGTIKGMSQIEVEGSIIGSTPLIGPLVQRILIGGDEVGHLTLTHLYFLHVALLPLVAAGLLVVHISQVYRYGLSSSGKPHGDRVPYWPLQTIRNMIVLGVVLGVLAVLAWRVGAPLDAPADSQLPHTPRPEWYLLFLFELRRYFSGDWEFVATMLVPLAALALLLAMPFLDRPARPRTSRLLRFLVVLVGAGSWIGLTASATIRDWRDAEYQQSRAESARLAERAKELADHGEIPPEGAVTLLENDPATQGPMLFAANCASCHSHSDSRGAGIAAEKNSAPNLYGIASRQWLLGLLDPEKFSGPQYFGNTKLAEGEMAAAVDDLYAQADIPEKEAELRADLKAVAAALSAEAAFDSQSPAGHHDRELIAHGRELITEKLGCIDCHRFHDDGELGAAPDLTAYGSAEWLTAMIANPQHERFYPGERNDRMPAFAADRDHPEANMLSPRQIRLLADWLRDTWYRPESEQNQIEPLGETL